MGVDVEPLCILAMWLSYLGSISFVFRTLIAWYIFASLLTTLSEFNDISMVALYTSILD